MSDGNCIAIVGAGNGGKAILTAILKNPVIRVKYVCDIDPEAPGIELARSCGITCIIDAVFEDLLKDPEVTLILEVTGVREVYEFLLSRKLPYCNIMSSSAAEIIFHLLDAQQRVTAELELYKNKLEVRIIERTEELEDANNLLQQKVIEYSDLNDKLQQINNEKTKYLLHATHQLKAPFAAIQSYTDILLDGYAGALSEKAHKVVDKIKVRCELLSKSIKEMLELANLKSCVEENIKMEPCSLSSLINKAIEQSAGVAEKRNIRIRFKTMQDDRIKCNKDQIASMVQVLVENAVNYSYDDSEVVIKLSKEANGRIILYITDHGIGIEEKNLKNIFKEYFRAYNAVQKHENGTGLGLAIADRIAHIHRTDIQVDSVLGEGSTFRIAFPVLKIEDDPPLLYYI